MLRSLIAPLMKSVLWSDFRVRGYQTYRNSSNNVGAVWKHFIKNDLRISVVEIAQLLDTSVGSGHTIVHDHLGVLKDDET